MLTSGIALFLLFHLEVTKEKCIFARGINIVKIWQDTSTLSQTGRSRESSVKNTAKTC